MKRHFVRTWGVVALRGAAGVVFGLAALFWFNVTLASLVLFFGSYALIDGVLTLLIGTRLQAIDRGWLMEGIVGIMMGLIAILWFGMSLSALVSLVALWALATGALEVSAAVLLRRHFTGEVSLGSAGMGSLLLGAVMLFWPSTNMAVFVILLGGYAVFFGLSMLLLAVQLRRSTMRLASFQSGYVESLTRR